jgi:hypothetical protein
MRAVRYCRNDSNRIIYCRRDRRSVRAAAGTRIGLVHKSRRRRDPQVSHRRFRGRPLRVVPVNKTCHRGDTSTLIVQSLQQHRSTGQDRQDRNQEEAVAHQRRRTV